jgi:hypothetical protein
MGDTLILFYHPESNPCKKLMDIIPKDKKISYINVVQVRELPNEITNIPSMIVNQKKILSGKDVFNYFQKNDDYMYVSLSNSKMSGLQNLYSTIDDDNNNVESSSIFSSINGPSITDGLVEYKEEKNTTLDLERLQAERSKEFQPIKKE